MDKVAFMFPGQGSQRVGMGLDLLNRWPELVDIYYRPADEILGYPLSTMCWKGPVSALREMPVTQPAVFLTSVATLHVLRQQEVVPDLLVGHSLGEYAALVCAGVLDWTDALRLVSVRGGLMAAVNDAIPGKMVAVIGLDLAATEQLCAQAASDTGQVVEVANHNDRTQFVISGQSAGVRRAMAMGEAAGAERVVELDIGGPAHCSLMSEIEDEFSAVLAQVTFRDPVIPVVSSVTGEPVTSATAARDCLRRQLTGRVNWAESVQRMTRDGIGNFVEVGPGRVLSRLSKRICSGARVHRTDDTHHLTLTVRACRVAGRVA